MIFKEFIKFFRLPGKERYALVRAALVLAAALLSLRLLGARRTLHWAGRPPGIAPSPLSGSDSVIPGFEKQAVDRAAAAMRTGTCLSKALALQLLLRRRGIASQLRFGIRKRDGSELLAHAWLEINGAPIGEHQDPNGTGLSVFAVSQTSGAT